MKYIVSIGNKEHLIEVIDDQHVALGDKVFKVNFDSIYDHPVYSLLLDGDSYEAYVYHDEGTWQVLLHGRLYQSRVEDEREKKLRSSLVGGVPTGKEYHLKAPMPGLVVAVSVEEGQVVAKGDTLVILESMKMQNELKSPREGKIVRVRVRAGDRIEQHFTILSVTEE
jgi:acetyl/propionyl-CoA carboxylase alpha subunit